MGFIGLAVVLVALAGLQRKYQRENERKIMSKVSEFAARVQSNFDRVSGDLDSILKEIQALNTRIQDLQNSEGTLDPVDQAALDTIANASAALAAKADVLANPAPAPPAPPAPPATAPAA